MKEEEKFELGRTLELYNPIKTSGIRIVSLAQIKEVHKLSTEIIENLSDEALNQLLGGTENDIDKLFDNIRGECFNVLFGEAGLIKESNLMYLEKLQKNVEETFRIENLNYFITSVLPEFEMNWHHLEWGQETMRYNKLGVIAARDHGKSFFFSNAVPIWKMYRYKSANDFIGKPRKELTLCGLGYLLTHENDLAKDLLEIVKNNIEDNTILREKLFPTDRENWAKERIRCRNGAVLRIKSYGSNFRGRHPGWIIVDDYLDDKVIYSESQRRKATDYFHSVIMNAIVPEGQVIVVGTPFHQGDLYGDLKTKKAWKIFEYPGILPNGRLLWRNRWSFEGLMDKRESQGNLIFSREILCKPISSESTIFPYNILKRSFLGMQDAKLTNDRESYYKKFNKVVVGLDFAISSSVGADYSVYTVWGIEGDDMYLMYIYRAKGKSYGEQIGIMKSINTNFRPDVMVAEANVFQQIFVETADNLGLPIYGHTTGKNKHDLREGWPSLAICFERTKIHLPRGDEYSVDMTDLICSELTSVAYTDKGLESVGMHDDTMSSMWLASIAAKKITTGVGFSFLED